MQILLYFFPGIIWGAFVYQVLFPLTTNAPFFQNPTEQIVTLWKILTGILLIYIASLWLNYNTGFNMGLLFGIILSKNLLLKQK